MNKYQLEMIKDLTFELVSEKGNGLAQIQDGVMVLSQNENYNIVDYVLQSKNDSIESIEAYTKKWIKGNDKSIKVSFNDNITKIRINFALVEPVELNVKMNKADKKAYDEEQLKALRQTFMANSSAVLIKNIFGPNYVAFNPCGEAYSYTEVEFIAKNNRGTTSSVFPRPHEVGGGGYAPTPKNVNIVLQRKRNAEGCNYVEFGNIGECGLVAHIYQYDKNGNLLIDYEIK